MIHLLYRLSYAAFSEMATLAILGWTVKFLGHEE